MAVRARLKKNAAAASKAVSMQLREPRLEQERRSLLLASAGSGRSVLSPGSGRVGPPKKVQDVEGDAEEGAGAGSWLNGERSILMLSQPLLTCVATFWSLRGFDASELRTAKAVPSPARAHRDRRRLANSVTEQRQQPIQRPNLTTVPSARDKVSSPQEPKSTVRRPAKSVHTPRPLRRTRFPYVPVNLPISDIDSLRQDLGLRGQTSKLEDAVYVAIDTEGREITEIGISTLDTRDIQGIRPGRRAMNWISKIKHKHIVVRGPITRPIVDSRRSTSLFCTSDVASVVLARTLVLSTLRSARDTSPDHAKRRVHLVGQSIGTDVGALNRGALRLNLSHDPVADFTFDKVYDTLALGGMARKLGACLPSIRLGRLARSLEVDPKYWLANDVVGTHNASNDAAYTMMVMLLFAVRWDTLAEDLVMPPPVPLHTRSPVDVTASPTVRPFSETLEVSKAQIVQWVRAHGGSKKQAKRKIESQRILAHRAEVLRQAWEEAGLVGKARIVIERTWARLAMLIWARWRSYKYR